MTIEECIALFEGIKERVEASAVPVVDAIAKTYEEHLVGFTLHESGTHAPVTRTPAPEGLPPAFMPGGLHGSLSGDMKRTPGVGGGGIATASVFPTVIYAAVQEYGATITAKNGPFMYLWIGYIGRAEVIRRGWRRHTVTIPPRPYMSTAISETIVNGSLVRAAERSFMAVVWGE